MRELSVTNILFVGFRRKEHVEMKVVGSERTPEDHD